jgi:putative hydrolase of the HAD superfamily
MNFILDIGNVLINFQPEAFLHSLLNNPSVEEKMYELIFKGEEWVRLDCGDITNEEACRIFCSREPQYREIIFQITERIPEMMTPIPETVELLPKIKAAGHKLYYLSNYHDTYRNYILREYPFFGLFDGGVFSCDVHMLKPSPEFYRHLLDKYALDPRDCLFFDDVERNVRTAELLGMKGVVFTSAQSIEKFI